MKKAIAYLFMIMLLMVSSHSTVWAVSTEDYLKQQKKRYEARVDAAEKKLEIAEKGRDTKVLAAQKKYIEGVEKIKAYWAKKGNLDKVLFYNKLLGELRKLVDEGESATSPEKRDGSAYTSIRVGFH